VLSTNPGRMREVQRSAMRGARHRRREASSMWREAQGVGGGARHEVQVGHARHEATGLARHDALGQAGPSRDREHYHYF
jgi:hypothetical protein